MRAAALPSPLTTSSPMSPLPLLIALSSVGIDAGWEPLKDGGLEYTVQIEPQQLRMLRPGGELVSEIPPQSRDIRRIRITVGTEKLARTDLPAAADVKENVLVAKSVVVPATATEPIAGPRFPGDPPAIAEKQRVAKENTGADAPVETPRPDTALVENPAAEKRVAGYPKTETALTAMTNLPTAPTTDDDKFGWPFLAAASGAGKSGRHIARN